MCGAEGFSGVSATRKAGEHCVIDHPPESYLKHKPDYKTDWYAGVYMRGGKKYVSKPYFLKKCNIANDILAHPVLNFLSQCLALIFAVLLFCLLLTCCQYKRVSNQYEAIKNVESADSRIVDRNAKTGDEEERPRRRNKPDVNTFGKKSAAEIEAQNKKADSEIELGELDVDFA